MINPVILMMRCLHCLNCRKVVLAEFVVYMIWIETGSLRMFDAPERQMFWMHK